MNKKAKIVISLLAILAAAMYFITSGSIITKKEKEQRCLELDIKVSESSNRLLVTEDDIKSILLSSSLNILSEPTHSIDINKIEELLLSKSYVKKAEVYTDINGKLNIRIEQRKPIIRVNTTSYGFYLDEGGFVFPLSKSFTDYVPIVTGNPPLPFSAGYKGTIPETENANFISKLLSFAIFLQDNPYWNSMIEQIHVVSENDVELITRVGSHVVKLGNFDDFEYKLHKLDVFYRNGMPSIGWNTYKVVNLAYSNQVVCK